MVLLASVLPSLSWNVTSLMCPWLSDSDMSSITWFSSLSAMSDCVSFRVSISQCLAAQQDRPAFSADYGQATRLYLRGRREVSSHCTAGCHWTVDSFQLISTHFCLSVLASEGRWMVRSITRGMRMIVISLFPIIVSKLITGEMMECMNM